MRASSSSVCHRSSPSRGTGFRTRDLLSAIRLPHRRTLRRFMRKAARTAVVVVMLASMLFNDESIYGATWRAIHEEQRISLRPGMWAVAGDNLRQAATRVLRSLNGLLPTWFPPGAPQVMRAPGMPYPWQAADPSVPFSHVNLANGSLFTALPVVEWQGLGLGIQFSLYHSTIDGPTDLGTTGSAPGWTHSYSRRLLFEAACGGQGPGAGFGGGESGFESESMEAPPADDPPEGGGDPGGDPSDIPGGSSSGEQFFGPEGGGGSSGLWLRTDDGRRIWFEDNGDTTYTAPPGIRLKLTRPLSAVYKLTDAQQNVTYFDGLGYCTSIQEASGNTIALEYGTGAAHRLLRVIDPIGNILRLRYTSGRLSSIEAPPLDPDTDPNVREFLVSYDITRSTKYSALGLTVRLHAA